MKTGFAKQVITPPPGTHLFGFGGRDKGPGCNAVHDDLFVGALYAEHDGEKALICGFDLLFFGREEADRLKGALGRSLDLSPRQILLNCSHTHCGPVCGSWAYADYEPIKDPLYIALVERAALKAAGQASETARETTLWAGRAKTRLPVSRRFINEQGKAEWRPSFEAPVYDTIPFVLFKDTRGQLICFLFSVSCHLSTMGGTVISADYPGAAIPLLDKHLGGTVSLFLQGCGGDTKARVIANGAKDDTGRISWRSGTGKDIEEAGQMVASEIISALDTGLTVIEPRIVTGLTELHWPLGKAPTRTELETELKSDYDLRRHWAQRQLLRLDRGETLTPFAPVLVQAIRLGRDLRLIALEGEPVGGFARLIEQWCNSGFTFPLGYSNGQGLYLPIEKMIPEGGYEVESAYEYGFPANLAPGYEALLSRTIAGWHEAGLI